MFSLQKFYCTRNATPQNGESIFGNTVDRRQIAKSARPQKATTLYEISKDHAISENAVGFRPGCNFRVLMMIIAAGLARELIFDNEIGTCSVPYAEDLTERNRSYRTAFPIP